MEFFSVVNENSLFPIWLMSSIRALAQPSTEARYQGLCCHFLKARNCFVIQNFPLVHPRILRQGVGRWTCRKAQLPTCLLASWWPWARLPTSLSFSRVQLFVTPWTAASQAPLMDTAPRFIKLKWRYQLGCLLIWKHPPPCPPGRRGNPSPGSCRSYGVVSSKLTREQVSSHQDLPLNISLRTTLVVQWLGL